MDLKKGMKDLDNRVVETQTQNKIKDNLEVAARSHHNSEDGEANKEEVCRDKGSLPGLYRGTRATTQGQLLS